MRRVLALTGLPSAVQERETEREKKQGGLRGFALCNWKNEIVLSRDGGDRERTHVTGKPRFLP